MEAEGDIEPSRRERNKQRTRDAIEVAALQLYHSQGFDGTTVDQIAQQADVSLRTFFRYFPSKEQVLFDHDLAVLDRLRELIAAQPPELGSLEAVRVAYREFALTIPERADDEHRRFVSIFLDSPTLRGRSGQVLVGWEQAVADGLRQREGAPDIDPDLAGTVVGGVLKWATRCWMRQPGSRLADFAIEALEQIQERPAPALPPAAAAEKRTTTRVTTKAKAKAKAKKSPTGGAGRR